LRDSIRAMSVREIGQEDPDPFLQEETQEQEVEESDLQDEEA